MASAGRRKNTVTLSDVAHHAGVSLGTASKALNGRAQVRAETREKVLASAAELRFTPNPFAQALNSTRTGTIGMLTNDLDSRFVLPVLLGAEDAFGADSASVLLCDARGDADREREHIRTLLAKRVDGIVLLGRTTNSRESITDTITVPVVYAYAPSRAPGDISFTPDNVNAGTIAAEHLLATGRRRIAVVNGEYAYEAARDRTAGAVTRLTDAGLALAGGDALYGDWTEGWGRTGTEAALRHSPDIDAIIAGSDHIARGVLDRLRELGRSVPDDVAVIGFDNWELLSAGARPSLTSIDMQLEELGRAAARSLFTAIDGRPSQPGTTRMPVRLVVRASTSPARA